MLRPDWKAMITDCFSSTYFMALSTHGDDGLWCNPVYFAWDDNFNLYFISELDCRHMRNIQSSSQVACAIFPTNQDNDVFGAYLRGHAEIIFKDHKDWGFADKTYYDRVYPDDPNWELRNAPTCYRQKDSWHLVKIILDELSYFDTRYFDENRVDIPLDKIKTT
jgi:uncharacterized protein YhbP (UPF0306 family)